ncbi:MAG TPA: protein kinase [Kofleriaceae bacterium]|nr:protein kinase [Kofleriaceae bacterium]
MQRGHLLGERFEIDQRVASGGMGQVFRARDMWSGGLVAVKMLHGEPDTNLTRFAHERRALAELSHPGIVRYIAHGLTASGEPYLAMEWLDGEDLAARLAGGKLSIEDSLALAARVAEALAAAHARDIVHRDLKPGNIFLEGGRVARVKVLDFGIARLEDATRVTLSGSILGTLGYMAPEQARAVHELDARADVFSLGCVLFECLTGTPAFEAEHPMALLMKLLFAEPPRLADVLPAAPPALDALLARMLAKEPADRPAHGGAVAEAIAALGSHLGAGGAVAAAPPATGLTLDEQRMLSVLVVGVEDEPWGHGEPAEPAPPEARAAQREQALRESAASWGGQLERLRDGSVAVALGGAGPVTDHAAQAARCALWLRTRIPGRRIALATGRADRTGRMPAAETIDRAARMLLAGSGAAEAAPPAGDSIAIDEITAGLLDARFDVREHDAGYALHGEREIAEGTRSLLGRATPCVGRDPELQALEQLFEECTEEPVARAALVTAPPGTGKSRLAQELLRAVSARGAPVAVWISRGEPHRAGSAFSLLAQLLRGACGIADGEPPDAQREKLAAHVAARVDAPARRHVAEFLGEIIGAPFPDGDSLPLRAARQDAQLMSDQLRAAFLELLAAELGAQPVLIVLEDLHWGDRPTVQFLDAALRDLRERPLFVLALARPEVRELFPRLWDERPLLDLSLKQLGKKASERLVRHVLGDTTERALVDRLVRLSEGNAFYLEELIRAAASGQRDDLPETVVAMVQSRLAALDDDERRILRAASIFGEVFWPGALTRLVGGAARAAAMAEALEELVDRELIFSRKQGRFPGEAEYAFRHALLREGAYATLTDEDRALGHRLAGEWLEQHGEPDPLALAAHFERGGDRARAGLHYLRAAELACRGGDSPAGIARVTRALDCGVPGELRTRCLGMLCELYFFTRTFHSDALAHAEEAVQIAPRGAAAWSQGLAIKVMHSLVAGKLEELMALLALAGETEPAPGAVSPWTLCLCAGVSLLDLLGRFRAAHQLLQKLTAGVRAAGDQEPIAAAQVHGLQAARMAYAEEDPMQGLVHAEAYSRLAQAIGHRRYVEYAKIVIGTNLWCLGAFAGTDRLLMEVNVSDSELGMGLSHRLFVPIWLLADLDNLDEARRWADRLIEAGRTRRMLLDESRGRWALAEVLRRAGELEAADAEIQAALAILRRAAPRDLPGALATLAAVRLAQARPAEALAAAVEGVAAYEAMGACGFFRGAFLRLVHARCLELEGDYEGAMATLAAARARLFAIAAKIDDPAYRESFLESVPENREILALARQWLDPDAPS